jgi:hypothetical protein
MCKLPYPKHSINLPPTILKPNPLQHTYKTNRIAQYLRINNGEGAVILVGHDLDIQLLSTLQLGRIS